MPVLVQAMADDTWLKAFPTDHRDVDGGVQVLIVGRGRSGPVSWAIGSISGDARPLSA